jgi:Tfp pilus assembly protein PilO
MTVNRLWVIGTAVLIVVILVLGWLLVIAPTVGQAQTARQQTRTTNSQNAAEQASIVRLKAQSKKLPQSMAQLAKLQKSIPESFKSEDFLDQMEADAASAGVVITNYTFGEAAPYGSASTSTTATAAPTPSPSTTAAAGGALSGKLFTVPISIKASGSIPQVIEFIRSAQQNPRFFLLPSATYAVGQASGTITGSVFILNESTGAAAK